MIQYNWFYIFLAIMLSGCISGESNNLKTETPTEVNSPENSADWVRIIPSATTVESRLPAPPGYRRIEAEPGSITAYLRKLPVKPDGSPVLLYNGSEKDYQDAQVAIIDMEIGNRNLQQCADAIMRLRAEYLYESNKLEQIHFNFTSGDRADYNKFAQGYRANVNGNKVSWHKKTIPSNSYKTFREYLDLVFTYAGTASLEKELQPVNDLKEIKPGDVLIQGGHPGHAVMVMDVAENSATGHKIYLLSQSYMPAQETHILKNPSNEAISPWYAAEATGEIKTPEWTFSDSQLKRFPTW